MSDSREELEARIAAYIDGQLSPAEAARLEVFLANTDPQLAERIIGMMGDRHRLRTLPKPAAPADLAGRIMEQVERNSLLNDVEHMAHPRRGWWQSRGMVAAAIGLMVGGFAAIVAISVVGKQRATLPPVALNDHHPISAPAFGGGTEDRESIGAAGSSTRDLAKGEEPPLRRAGDSAAPAAPTLAFRKDLERAEQSKADAPSAAAEEKFTDALQAQKAELEVRNELERNRSVVNDAPAAAKFGYKTVDSSEQALANIAAGDSQTIKPAEPVVITLVAHDEQDFARLRAALIDMVSQDPGTVGRQAVIQNRVAALYSNQYGVNGTVNGANGGLAGANGSVFANSAAVNGTLAGNPPSANAAATAPASNANGFEAGATARGGGEGGRGGGGGGAQGAGDASVANSPAIQYQILNDKKEFAPVPDATRPAAANQAVTGSLTLNTGNTAGNASNQVNNQMANGNAGNSGQLQFGGGTSLQNALAGENPAAQLYRVALRESQLRRLAAEFRVESVSRGPLAYVIAPPPPETPVAAAPVAGSAAPLATPAPAATPNVQRAQAPPDHAAEAQKDASFAEASQATQQGKPELRAQENIRQTAASDKDVAEKSGRWIECVITMEREAQTTNGHAAPPANEPQAK